MARRVVAGVVGRPLDLLLLVSIKCVGGCTRICQNNSESNPGGPVDKRGRRINCAEYAVCVR